MFFEKFFAELLSHGSNHFGGFLPFAFTWLLINGGLLTRSEATLLNQNFFLG